MTGTASRRSRVGSAFCEESGSGIDGEDADEIGAEIWDDDVFLGWVQECFVGMRGQLSLERIGSRAGHGKGDGLEGRESSICLDIVGGERGTIAVVC